MSNQRSSRQFAIALIVVALTVAVAQPAPAQRLGARFEVGDVFPDLELPSLEDGSPAKLSDFRGRKVMLHVFASW